ncbi:hypothetical protein OPW39_15660 [Vibrio europaeus]|uniref:hypothetical protein n=1 Tax=Vibrio europaeus TaxID=300876 RepID=UPI00233F1A68|nr:hypothetical protein [Vibrio europaeus]MDC5870244.1 hypothetical protein [Vibrio europaeus]
MRAQLTPKNLKVGQILYYVSTYTDDDDGKTEIDLQEYQIRSIKKKRGSQTKNGRAYFVEKWKRSDTVYVNMTRRVTLVTIDKKTGQWLKSIPKWMVEKFDRDSERLPSGYYTTPEAAFKYCIHSLEEDLKQAKLPKEKRTMIVFDPIEVIEKELRLCKARLTKFKNKKAKK